MKIIVMQCSNQEAWYRDKIGKTYTVQENSKGNYLVKDKAKTREISRKDAEVI